MTASRAPLRQIAARPIPRSVPQRKAKPKPTSQARLLHRLKVVQNISVTISFVLTGCVFVVYGWSVHTQKRWNEQYTKLEYYKQMEVRLINAAEALQNDRIHRAWEEGTLVRETPDRVIFVEAMPPRAPVTIERTPREPVNPLPIAY